VNHNPTLKILSSALILGAVVLLLPLALFFLAPFGIPWDWVFAVTPVACPKEIDYTKCYSLADIVRGWWSYPLWIVVAFAFAVQTRKFSLGRRLVIAVLVVICLTAIIYLAWPLLGYQHWADTL